MKKLSFLILFLMLTTVTFAQQGGKKTSQGKGQAHGNKHKTPEEKAEAGTRKLTGLLNLTSDQQPKVKEVLLTRAQKVQSIREKYANNSDKSQMHTELKAAKTESDNSLKAILTPEQYSQYEKAKQERKNKNKEHKQGPKTSKEPGNDSHDMEQDDLDVD